MKSDSLHVFHICVTFSGCVPRRGVSRVTNIPVLLARTFLLFGRIPKYGFGHETDRLKCYGRKNTGKFGVSAIRIQWTTSRTEIRPQSRKKKFERTILGYVN